MGIILLVLLLAIILGGLGFAIHILWWIELVVLVLWLLGFLVRVGEGTSRSRWYRWCPAFPADARGPNGAPAAQPAPAGHLVAGGRRTLAARWGQGPERWCEFAGEEVQESVRVGAGVL